MRQHIRAKSVLAGLLWLLAMLWPNVQAFAAQNDDLSWLLCAPAGQFDLSPAEIETYKQLGLIDDAGPQQGDHSKTCPFQGCLGSAHAGLDLPVAMAMPMPAQRTGLSSTPIQQDIRIIGPVFSSRNPRAPPAISA